MSEAERAGSRQASREGVSAPQGPATKVLAKALLDTVPPNHERQMRTRGASLLAGRLRPSLLRRSPPAIFPSDVGTFGSQVLASNIRIDRTRRLRVPSRFHPITTQTMPSMRRL
jgi:hypothetical protein